MRVGYTLLLLRVKNNLTRKQVAYKLNVSNDLIRDWEEDTIMPTKKELKMISALYNVTTRQILSGEIAYTQYIDLRIFSQLREPVILH
jgi:transcriptional regulator with XRE-family HTH domain